MERRLLGPLLAVLLLGRSSLAKAQTEEATVPKETAVGQVSTERLRMLPDTLVVAGGVSLGSYQAGFAYLYTLMLHPERDRPPGVSGGKLKLVTGASAGSINALLAALATCKRAVVVPESSIFYRTWIPVGVREEIPGAGGLVDETAVTARAFLSRGPIRNRIVQASEYFEGRPQDPGSLWLNQSCDVALGFVTTRLAPRAVPLQVGLQQNVERQTEKFLLRLHREPNGAPTFRMFPLPARDDPRASLSDLYPSLGANPPGDRIPFWADNPDAQRGTVGQLLQASSSVPFAFEPTRLDFRLCNLSSERGRLCEWSEPASAEFVDGAVFENVPVRLARRMRSWDLGESTGTDTVVLDTDTESWSRASVPRNASTKPSLLGDAATLISGVLGSTMGAELLSAFENEPGLRVHPAPEAQAPLHFPLRRAPTASGHFANFLGFFERDFRVFDFHLGMLDARHFVRHELGLDPDMLGIESRRYTCFAAWDDASDHFDNFPSRPVPECDPLGVGKFDPAEHAWQPLEPETLPAETQTSYNLVRLLAASTEFRAWTESPDYDDGVYPQAEKWFSLLQKHRVYLRQITAQSPFYTLASVVDPRVVIANTVAGLVPVVAARQHSFGERVGASVLGRVATNLIYYQEPRHFVSVSGRWNRGADVSLGVTAQVKGLYLRPELGARFTDLELRIQGGSWFRQVQASARTRLSVLLAPSLRWSQALKAVFQPEIFAGYAYGYRFQRYATDYALQRVSLGAHFVLIQRFFVDLELSSCTSKRECRYQRRARADDDAGTAAAEGALTSSRFAIDLGLGWRWLW